MPKPFEEDDDAPPSRRAPGRALGRKTDWFAKIKNAPAHYWVIGLGAGALAVDYFVEKDRSIVSAAYRGIFGSKAEVPPPGPPHAPPRGLLHGIPGRASMPPAMAPYAPGYVPPSAVPIVEPGYAMPGYAMPGYAMPGYAMPGYAMPGYAMPGYYPAEPSFYPAVHHRGAFPWERTRRVQASPWARGGHPGGGGHPGVGHPGGHLGAHHGHHMTGAYDWE